MAHQKTPAMALVLFLTLSASTALSQGVHYVTRNVQPTTTVRFGAQPLRITITDRGIRQPLASAPVVKRGFKGKFKCGFHRHGFRTFHGRGHRFGIGGHRFGGGGVIVLRDSDTGQIRHEPRSRTIYGKNHPRHPDAKARAVEAPKASEPSPKRVADPKHMQRVFALIQARRAAQEAAENQPENRRVAAQDPRRGDR
ncbi:MAG: hypothetical protein AAF937_02690 [Planctomycetota bacterium]